VTRPLSLVFTVACYNPVGVIPLGLPIATLTPPAPIKGEGERIWGLTIGRHAPHLLSSPLGREGRVRGQPVPL